MGNQCDQCQAVTQGCKRDQFRTQLKNRQKLDLSRQDKSKSKLESLTALRNVPLIEASKNSVYESNSVQNQQSLQIVNRRKPPKQDNGQSIDNSIQRNRKQNRGKQNVEHSREHHSRYPKQQVTTHKIKGSTKQKNLEQSNIKQQTPSQFYESMKFIKLPIESGIDVKNNRNKLQQLQKELLMSRQPMKPSNNVGKGKLGQNQNKHSQTPQKKIQANKSSYDAIRQEIGPQSDKENSFMHVRRQQKVKLVDNLPSNIRSNEEILINRNPGIVEKVSKSSIQGEKQIQKSVLIQFKEKLAQQNPSVMLKQFNSSLQESPILKAAPVHPLHQQQSSILPQEQFSLTSHLQTVENFQVYLKPGVYFKGFVSIETNKVSSQGHVKFENDGTEMQVFFKNGRIDTKKNVTLAMTDGTCFRGQVNKQSNGDFMVKGEGKVIFDDGSYYVGEWLKNMPHGTGKHVFNDGSVYEGEFIEGKKQGKGKFSTFESDLIYAGSFLADRIEGEGQMEIIEPTSGKRRRYKGYFKNGRLQGQNCQVYYIDEEAKYIGGFKDGKKNGQGKYYFGDGRMWEGEWKQNRQNGWGRFRNYKGAIVEGYWMDGIRRDEMGMRRNIEGQL